jgi:hypothetical protein
MPDIDARTWRSPNHNHRPDGVAPSMIILHSCEGRLPAPRAGSLPWLCNPQPKNPSARVSCHYYVCRDGAIFQLVDDSEEAWHAGASLLKGEHFLGRVSLGIELEHRQGQNWPVVQLNALRALCLELIARYRIPQDRIVAHRWIAVDRLNRTGRKSDPTDWPDTALKAWIAGLYTRPPAPLPAPIPVPAPPAMDITADSPLLAAPRATAAQAVAYVMTRGSAYVVHLPGVDPARDIKLIASYYWRYAPQVGLDPLLAWAQCIHETGNLSSWWSARPRRNPCGFGVTGATAPRPPTRGVWQYDGKRWREGLAFSSWEVSVQAHLGRLLAYALLPGRGNEAQRTMMAFALGLRSLPHDFLGVAPTLRGLNGRWAVPGLQYGQSIAKIAASIAAQRI